VGGDVKGYEATAPFRTSTMLGHMAHVVRPGKKGDGGEKVRTAVHEFEGDQTRSSTTPGDRSSATSTITACVQAEPTAAFVPERAASPRLTASSAESPPSRSTGGASTGTLRPT